MKEKLLNALKTKFSGVSEAILERIAVKKAGGVTDESQITAIVDGISFQDVLTSYGDYRANEANVSSVRNYEEKHGLKDGKPVVADDEGANKGGKTSYTTEELDSYFTSKLEAAIKPYKDEIETLKKDKSQTDRQAAISNAMKKLGLTEDEMQFVTVPENKDPEEYLTGYKQHLITKGLKPADDSGAQVSESQVQDAVATDWLNALGVPEAKV
ncbi:hypothetical protein [Bacteroides caccae]|uniref:hypothetical protein n=1 Tax=Bacteroides caccae TaxID=47678 RepID=UPI0022AA39A0|nr:hypothetical protein [Bacteroides caccae]MCZ2726289.1 hypothetical protein [Bacteroides caccae]